MDYEDMSWISADYRPPSNKLPHRITGAPIKQMAVLHFFVSCYGSCVPLLVAQSIKGVAALRRNRSPGRLINERGRPVASDVTSATSATPFALHRLLSYTFFRSLSLFFGPFPSLYQLHRNLPHALRPAPSAVDYRISIDHFHCISIINQGRSSLKEMGRGSAVDQDRLEMNQRWVKPRNQICFDPSRQMAMCIQSIGWDWDGEGGGFIALENPGGESARHSE